jgi:hypothetical protein
MSIRNDKLGNPILEDFDELTLQYFNSSSISRNILFGITEKEDFLRPPRLKSDRSASVQDIYDMIGSLLPKYQMSFVASSKNDFLLAFPFMIVEPSIGNKIRNINTGEIYTVRYVPKTRDNKFYGAVLLDTGTNGPKVSDKLEFVNPSGVGPDKDKLVNFYHAYPEVPVISPEDGSGDTGITRSEPFTPTIVVEMIRQEPGSVGKRPFDMMKEVKPRIREIYKHPDDPANYSIQVRGQWYDNILRFTCYSTTSFGAEKLIAWFNDFLYKYAWVLKKNGVQELLYWQRRADQTIQTWRDDIVGYTVEWYFRTEEHTVEVIHNVTSIDISGRTAWSDSAVSPPTGQNPEAAGTVMGPFGDRFANLFSAFHDESGNYLYGNYDQIDQRNKDTG